MNLDKCLYATNVAHKNRTALILRGSDNALLAPIDVSRERDPSELRVVKRLGLKQVLSLDVSMHSARVAANAARGAELLLQTSPEGRS